METLQPADCELVEDSCLYIIYILYLFPLYPLFQEHSDLRVIELVGI